MATEIHNFNAAFLIAVIANETNNDRDMIDLYGQSKYADIRAITHVFYWWNAAFFFSS